MTTRILKNACVYTPLGVLPAPSAISIDGSRITAVGSYEEVLSKVKDPTQIQVEELGGKTVLPGLTDAHIHLEYYARGLQKVDCETLTRPEMLERVHAAAVKAPPGAWVLGHGWNHNNWPEGYGTAEMLDEVTAGHPAYLTSKSLHSGWANSAALKLAGIDSTTPDPSNGVIQRAEDGSPTGILLEKATERLEGIIPAPTPEELSRAVLLAQETLWQMGITGVHDFDSFNLLTALQNLDGQNQLRLRVVKGIPRVELDEAIKKGYQSGYGSPYLRIGAVKLFSDGALGPQTGAMLEPYEGSDGNLGMLMLEEDEIFEIGQKAAQAGLNLAIHAIGDRAVRTVLNAYARLRQYEKQQSLPPRRNRIEHVQIIHPEDAPRLAELGVIASMQPIHATSDMLMADRFWGARAKYSYAWKFLQSRGAALAFGSDSPVEPANPFLGLHACITRRRADGSPAPDGWQPQERLTFLEALHGFTEGAAYAAGLERSLGRLAPGYLADLIVLDENPQACPADELLTTRPAATMVGGEWVWKR